MNLDDLVIFRAVVDAGGITRAAQQLHRVQSNVTTRIRQLEEKLGTALFIREGKRLHLSPSGQVLLDYAHRLLALADEAREAVRDGEPRGPLTLGAMESTAAVRLPAPLAEYARLYPQVRLGLRTGNPQQMAAAVLAGEVDAAFVTGDIVDGPFEKLPVFTEPLVIVARAGHAPMTGRKGVLPPGIVAFEKGCPHRARLEALYAQSASMPAQVVEITSYHAMLGCVAVGMGVSLVPRSVLETFPERARLSLHALPRGQDRAVTELIWRRGASSPRLAALVRLLKG